MFCGTRQAGRLGLWIAVLFLGSSGARGEIFALPKSDRLLAFEVTVPGFYEIGSDGQQRLRKIGITTREGTLVQIQDKAHGYWYGFIADRDKAGVASLSQFGILSPAPDKHEATGPFLSQRIERGRAVSFFGTPAKLNITVRFLGEKPGSFPDVPPFTGTIDNNDTEQLDFLEMTYGDPSESVCCVGCGPLRFCADAVNVPGCGTCSGGGGGHEAI